jgi:hypothetical protein
MIQDVCLIELDDISNQTKEHMTLDKDLTDSFSFFVLGEYKRKNFSCKFSLKIKENNVLAKVKYANVKRKKERKKERDFVFKGKKLTRI